ncbi:BA14K family protein [Roseibium sp.]|uniref:BA14K family protein n=1 Tax=Roseibium sp. TaxID=1936156 RepID=UPI003A979074
MTKTKKIIAVFLTGTFLLPAVSAAEAGSRHGWRDHDRGSRHHNYQPRRHNNNRIDPGAAVAAGIFGLAAGALIAGAANNQRNSYSAPVPAPGTATMGYQPWSPAWYRYCSSKYRSFNPNTGTFTTYGGEQKFCQ